MLVAIVGTRGSGKSTIEHYLLRKGFIPIRIVPEEAQVAVVQNASEITQGTIEDGISCSIPTFGHPTGNTTSEPPGSLCFSTASKMLVYVTQNWRANFVTEDLKNVEDLETFIIRPFLMVISVDAPIFTRFQRLASGSAVSLEGFVLEHDADLYGSSQRSVKTEGALFVGDQSPLHSLRRFVTIHIINDCNSIAALHSHLDRINILDADRLRPSWDTYFMTLASLASMRSNCMKRRVGAILVRDKRIVATGYNGTPRGLANCNEGGCDRCNSGNELTSEACLCLHAEENALLEAGRERIGDATLYCNTCPCLTCTIKIVQVGVREVVYNHSYKVDDASAKLFQDAGVILRRHALPP